MITHSRGPAVGGWCGMKFSALFVAFVGCCVAASSQAANIQIQFEGLDISYSAATGNIVEIGNPDQLSVANFLVDGVSVGTDVTDVTIDLLIPNVDPILDNVTNIVSSDPGGSLVLDFGGGEFVNLTLDEVTVIFLSVTNTFEFVAAASVASINGQSLPFGLTLTEPVTVSFSTQVATLVAAGAFVNSFTASGTGEIAGNVIIPEPTSLGLLALGGLLTSMMAYRYRLG